MTAISLPELTCTEMVTLMTDYLEGALSPADHARFEAHIAGCDGCDRYLAQMRQTLRAVGVLNEQSIPPQASQKLLQAFRDWKRAHSDNA